MRSTYEAFLVWPSRPHRIAHVAFGEDVGDPAHAVLVAELLGEEQRQRLPAAPGVVVELGGDVLPLVGRKAAEVVGGVIEPEAVDAAREPVIEDAEEVLARAHELPAVRAVVFVVIEELHVGPVVGEVVADAGGGIPGVAAQVEAGQLVLQRRAVAAELRPLPIERLPPLMKGAHQRLSRELRAARPHGVEVGSGERRRIVDDARVQQRIVVGGAEAPQLVEVVAAGGAIAHRHEVGEVVHLVVVAEVVERDVEQHLHAAGVRGGDHLIERVVAPAGRGRGLVAAGGDAGARERAGHVQVVAHRVRRAEVVAAVGQPPAVVVGEQRHQPDGVGAHALLDVAERDALVEVGAVVEEIVERAQPDGGEVGELAAAGAFAVVGDRRRGPGGAGGALPVGAGVGAAGVGAARLHFVEHELAGGQIEVVVVERRLVLPAQRRRLGAAGEEDRGEDGRAHGRCGQQEPNQLGCPGLSAG